MRLFVCWLSSLLLMVFCLSPIGLAQELDLDVTGSGSSEEWERELENIENAQKFAKEFSRGDAENVLNLLTCAHAAEKSLDQLGLSSEEQKSVYQVAKQRALPHLRQQWKKIQGDLSNKYLVSDLRFRLRLYGMAPADIGTTEEALEKISRSAIVHEALAELQNYERARDRWRLFSFCVDVEVHALSAEELGLEPMRFKKLLHVNAVFRGERMLVFLRDGVVSWHSFAELQQLITDGVALEEIGSSEEEWQGLQHRYHVYQARWLLAKCREERSVTRLKELKDYLANGVTFKDLGVTPEVLEVLPHQFDVDNAKEALQQCKANDSQNEFARLEQLLDRGVALEEVGLTQKKLDALRQYIHVINE